MIDRDFSNYRIVIIDDDSAYCKLLSTLIKKYFNVQSETFINPKLGLKHIQKQPPDLLVLDLEMPSLDGFTFMKILRSNPELKDLPVIISTGISTKELIINLAKLNITDYILKNTDISVILKKIYSILETIEK